MTGRPDACANCGTPLVAAGRFCTNCGAPATPVSLRTASPTPTPEAEQTAHGDPYESLFAAPAPLATAPPTAPASGTAAPASEPAPTSFLPPAPPAPPAAEPLPSTSVPPGGAPGPGLWIGAGLLLLAVLVLGSYLLLHGSGSDSPSTASTTPLVPKAQHSSKPATSPSSSAGSSAPASSAAPATNGRTTEVAGLALATAPSNAPPGVDFSGQTVTYVAGNMVDGRADTCWRVDGDASGTVLSFRLAQPTRLTEVGLINGYDKIAFSGGRSYDWYAGNRRIMSVEWQFDDGTTVDQQLGFSRSMQRMTIDPVTTQSVQLHIVSVSPPGHGPAARNDTAVSEVSLKGVVQ